MAFFRWSSLKRMTSIGSECWSTRFHATKETKGKEEQQVRNIPTFVFFVHSQCWSKEVRWNLFSNEHTKASTSDSRKRKRDTLMLFVEILHEKEENERERREFMRMSWIEGWLENETRRAMRSCFYIRGNSAVDVNVERWWFAWLLDSSVRRVVVDLCDCKNTRTDERRERLDIFSTWNNRWMDYTVLMQMRTEESNRWISLASSDRTSFGTFQTCDRERGVSSRWRSQEWSQSRVSTLCDDDGPFDALQVLLWTTSDFDCYSFENDSYWSHGLTSFAPSSMFDATADELSDIDDPRSHTRRLHSSIDGRFSLSTYHPSDRGIVFFAVESSMSLTNSTKVYCHSDLREEEQWQCIDAIVQLELTMHCSHCWCRVVSVHSTNDQRVENEHHQYWNDKVQS